MPQLPSFGGTSIRFVLIFVFCMTHQGLVRGDEADVPQIPETVNSREPERPNPEDGDARVRRAELVAKDATLRQYASDMAMAQVCWQLGRLDRTRSLLERHRLENRADDYRGIEWHLLWRLSHAEKKVLTGHANAVQAIAFLPDDSGLISADMSYTYASPGEIRAWPLGKNSGDSDASSGRVLWTQEAIKTPTYTYFTGFRSLVLNPDATLMAVTDGDNVKVLERATGQIKWTLKGHTASTRDVAFSPDGKTLASGGLDKCIKLWNPETGELVTTLTGHAMGVLTVAFSPDGMVLAAGGGDDQAPESIRRTTGELRLWSMANQQNPQVVNVSSLVSSVEFSPDGKELGVGMFDGTISILEGRGGVQKRIIKPSASPIASVRFSPDSQNLATASADGLVRLWEVEGGTELATYRGHPWWADSLAFSHDGRTLASGSSDRTIRLWDTQVHPERTRIRLPAWSIHDVVFTSDNLSLAVSDYRNVWLIDARTNRIRKSWPIDHWTFATAVSPDDSLIATAGEREPDGGGGAMIRLWDLKEGTLRADLPTTLDSAVRVTFSSDSRTLVGKCCDKARTDFVVKLWDVASGEVIGTWPNAVQAEFSPDSRWLAVAITGQIVLFDVEKRKTTAIFSGDEEQVRALQFSPDGTRLASAGDDKTVKIRDVQSREVLTILNGHLKYVEQILFAPDGQSLLTADAAQARVWNIADATVRFTLPVGKCPMVFTPDSRTLITAPGEVHLWQVATGDELLTYPHYGYDSRCLAISSDGKSLAQAGGNRDETNGVWIWSSTASDP